jgi:hypothetical protein
VISQGVVLLRISYGMGHMFLNKSCGSVGTNPMCYVLYDKMQRADVFWIESQFMYMVCVASL